MDFDPVEGLHYIFDRYAFLNTIMEDGKFDSRVTEASDQAEIKKVTSLARAMYHPDRQARAGAEMKKSAEQKTLLIADCERFLLKPELKSFYDERLADFRANKPSLVSTNGVAIISLGESYFDVGALLSDKVTDTSGFEAQVKAMLQYDETRLPQMKSLYDLMPENPQARSLYRDALTQKLVYLALLEDAAWAKVGYMNRKDKMDGVLIRSSDYAHRVEAALQKAADNDINATIERHGAIAQIGMAKTPLQLEFNVEAAKADAPGSEIIGPEERFRLALDEKKAVARQNFEIRADYVREVAKEKQAVLEELCTLTPVEAVAPALNGQTVYDFYLLNPPENGQQRALLRMTLDITNGNAGIAEVYRDNRTLADLKNAGFERGGFAVTRNAEISDIMIEIGAACERFLDKLEKDNAAKPAPAAPKPPGFTP
jgi:hypothetical protein